MSEPVSRRTCPECGLDYLPKGKGHGCPHCLLRLAVSGAEPGPGSAEQPQTPPGLRSRFFGDYEILQEIAHGGMGVVYRARQLGLNRLVALKMVQSSHLLSDEARLRFRVEIEAVAQLHHPHIVPLYESGEHDGMHYFTMRLVEGGDLAAALKQDRPLRERVQLLIKVCRAVHYAHQRGVLHRDLKPSNVLVDPQGEPQVADFGLAKSLDHESGFTFTSSVLGSPNYMAPEQATGKARPLTTAVDVYGLGAILYHLLAGRPPFQAPTPIETLRQVADRDPAPPRSIRPQADPDLETIALKCLRKEPAARYGTAEELAQDLERWLAGRPILARPLGPFAMAWRWSRRHPLAAGLAVALAVALAVITVGTGMAAVRIRRAEQTAAGHLRESLLREAGSLRLGSELGHRDEGLRLLREAVALGGPAEFRRRARNELLATLARTEPRFVSMPLSNFPARLELHAIHPGFEAIASVRNGTNVVFHARTNAASLGRLDCAEPVSRLDAFSPNGNYLALWHGDRLSVWDLRTGERCLTHAGTNSTFAFHPREEAILLQTSPNEAVWFDLPSGQEGPRWKAPLPRLSGRPSGWHTLAFSPDGRLLAGASETSPLVEFMDPRTGEQIRVVTNDAHTVAMTWSPNNRSIAVATADSKVLIWSPSSGALLWMSPAMIAPAHSLAFHPQRAWLAAACRDGRIRFIDTLQQRFVFEFPGESLRLAFSPGGGRLGPVWSRGEPGWLETRRSDAFASFLAGPSWVRQSWVRLTDGGFSPDGQLLAVGHLDLVALCDPVRGRRVKMMRDWRMSACVFHPREKHLIAADSRGMSRYDYESSPRGISLSPPEVIHAGNSWRAFAFSPDGRHFAAFNGRSNAVFVFDQTLTNCLASFGPHAAAESIAISPDGRWVATGSRSDQAVRVWEVASASWCLSLPAGLHPRSAFSNDGRWLAVSDEQFELREAGTWQPAPPLPFSEKHPILGASAFSPDSRLLALVVNRFEVHLFDLRTFEALGVLRPPDAIQVLSLVFSPDGSQLAGIGAEARVAVWNMREVQRSLEEFGLAWDSPAPRSAPP